MNHRLKLNALLNFILKGFLILVFTTALGGGSYGLIQKNLAEQIQLPSIFKNFFWPSIILIIFVGGSSFIAFMGLFLELPFAKYLVFLAGLTLAAWITIQVQMIGYISWLQPFMGAIGSIILILSLTLNIENNN